MRLKLLSSIILFLVALAVSAAPPKDKWTTNQAAQIDNDTYIDANNILMFVTNHGNFGRDLGGRFGKDAGAFFPFNTVQDIESGLLDDWIIFASGLWIGGQVNGQTRVAIAEFDDEYVPGPMASGTFLPDDPAFKIYKLYSDSLGSNPNADYSNWPVDQRAPTKPDGSPDMLGDQMLWSVFNDANPSQHANDAGSTAPLGVEVSNTVFAFDQPGALGNIIFLRYRIHNRGPDRIDNCYFSLWSDPDLGDAGDDFVGCDTTIGLGFVYNADNDDANHYLDKAPSVGYDLLQGPLVFTGDMADTGFMWDADWPGYQNLGMVSFNKYINGTDPNDFNESYAFMRGLAKDAQGVVGPYVFNGDTLLYQQSGDPVAGTGDLDVVPSDRRFMLSTGPITFSPGDSVEFYAAIVVGQGANNLNSITIMKQFDLIAKDLYKNSFQLGFRASNITDDSLYFPNVTDGSYGERMIDLTSFPTGMAFTATTSSAWLSVTPASGTTPATLTASVNPAGLAGQLEDTIVITQSKKSELESLKIPVYFDVASDIIVVGSGNLPATHSLSQNYPNPFNPETRILFALPEPSHVTLDIYNVLGRRIRGLVNERLSAGYQAVTWDGLDDNGSIVSSGIYFYRISANGYSESKKMVLLK